MNDHIPDATKMIQGTPRMDSALRRSQEDYTESYLLTEGLKLERELNAANAIIRQQQLLEEENLRLKDRIKRLEEAGDAMAKDFAHFWTDRNSVRDWPKLRRPSRD